MTTIRVLGLDLSLGQTGIALPDGELATIRPHRTDTGYARHWTVADAVAGHVHTSAPDVVLIEGYLLFGKRPNIAGLEIGGIVRAILHRRGVPFVDVPPSTLKVFAVNDGRATKEQMFDAARALCAQDPPRNDDEADAFWLRRMGVARYLLGTDHRAFQKITWPEIGVPT